MRPLVRLRSALLERRARRGDAPYFEGYETATAEADEVIADKDAFIAEQSAIIATLIDVINSDCPSLFASMPADLHERLRDYV